MTTMTLNGKTFEVDDEIASIVHALNAAGISTVASCSGHGMRPGRISLADGRELFVLPSYEIGQWFETQFPRDINGQTKEERTADEPSARQCNHGAISPKGTMLYHGYVHPKANLWRCDVCKGIYEGNLTEPNTLGSQALTLVGPYEPPPAVDVAPIAKLTVRDGLVQRAGLYAPGLPDGDHDVFPVPLSPKGELRPHVLAEPPPAPASKQGHYYNSGYCATACGYIVRERGVESWPATFAFSEHADRFVAMMNGDAVPPPDLLREVVDALECRDPSEAHYCPNCDRSLYDITQKARAALTKDAPPPPPQPPPKRVIGEYAPGFRPRDADETSEGQPWKCTICNNQNPDDATHCRQCEYSRTVMRDGQRVPRDGRL